MIENKSIIENIKKFILLKNLSVSNFEFQCGIKSGLIGAASKNNGAIGSDKILKILETFPEIDANWLLLGKGEMIKSEEKNINIENTANGNGNTVQVGNIKDCEKENIHLKEQLAEKKEEIAFLRELLKSKS